MTIRIEVKHEHSDFAHDNVTNPEVHAGNVLSADLIEGKLAGVERGAPAEEQEVVDEPLELLDGRRRPTGGADDAQAWGGPPEVAPPPGQHARPHGLLRREEGEDAVQHRVREGADEVASARRSRFLGPFCWRHSVERLVSTSPPMAPIASPGWTLDGGGEVGLSLSR